MRIFIWTAFWLLFSFPVLAKDKDMSCAQVNAQLSILNDIKTTVGGDYEAMSSEDRKNMSQKWHHEIPVKQAVYEEDGFEERMIRLVSLSQKHGCE